MRCCRRKAPVQWREHVDIRAQGYNCRRCTGWCRRISVALPVRMPRWRIPLARRRRRCTRGRSVSRASCKPRWRARIARLHRPHSQRHHRRSVLTSRNCTAAPPCCRIRRRCTRCRHPPRRSRCPSCRRTGCWRRCRRLPRSGRRACRVHRRHMLCCLAHERSRRRPRSCHSCRRWRRHKALQPAESPRKRLHHSGRWSYICSHRRTGPQLTSASGCIRLAGHTCPWCTGWHRRTSSQASPGRHWEHSWRSCRHQPLESCRWIRRRRSMRPHTSAHICSSRRRQKRPTRRFRSRRNPRTLRSSRRPGCCCRRCTENSRQHFRLCPRLKKRRRRSNRR